MFTCAGCKFAVQAEPTPQQQVQNLPGNIVCYRYPPLPIALVHPHTGGVITTDSRPSAEGGCGEYAPHFPGILGNPIAKPGAN